MKFNAMVNNKIRLEAMLFATHLNFTFDYYTIYKIDIEVFLKILKLIINIFSKLN